MKNNLQFLIVSLVLTLLLLSCKESTRTQDVAIGKVTRGTLYLEVYEEGEIEAVNSTAINVPNISWRYGNLKINQLVKDGEEVNKGDTLIVFDPSEVNKGIIEAETRLQMSLAQLEKLEAQQESDLEEVKADYEVSKISQQISQINFESAAYEAGIKKKEIALNLEKANIALDRAKEQIKNKIKIQKENLRQRELGIEQDRNRLKEAHSTINKLFVRSPTSGIAIINKNFFTGNKFQLGDQTWRGFSLIQLPDLSSLKANVKINEIDISKISKGLEVEIKPDAFSDSVYTGAVSSVANLAINKEGSSKIKVFPVEITINEKSKQLLPGLSVSCRIIVGKVENVLLLPLDALHTNHIETFVYKKSGSGFEKILVETSSNNSDYVVITKGLDEQDEVALSDPFESEDDEKSETVAKKEK